VNLIGCFFIALVLTIAAMATVRDSLRLFLTTGIMGGLTTYSTFDWETTSLYFDGKAATATLYLGATLVGCFLTGLLGVGLARVVAS
jgi:CrcB protein